MCDKCKNKKCKEQGFKYSAHCATAYQWSIFGVCSTALFIVLMGVYLIARITDGKWASWQLPVILVIGWLVSTIVGALFCSLKNIRIELKETKEPVKG